MNVNGKTVLITGGAGGLGSAIAKLLASKGAVVFVLDLPSSKEAAEKLIAEIREAGGQAYYEPMDGTKEADWAAVVEDALAKTGKVDVLVNNAGITILKKLEDISIEEWMRVLEVNVGSAFLGCKYVMPHMRKQGGGAIINTSSQCGLIGHKYSEEAYTASKGAVNLMTKSIASRYGKDNIRCNAICPSTAETPLTLASLQDPQFAEERLGEVPLGRLCKPEDVANAVLYLASDEGSYINGIALPVDGGSTCD